MKDDLISRQAAIDAIEKHIRTAEEPYRLKDTDRILNHAFDIAASCVYNLPSAQQWIPCSERLPDDDVEVFVYLFERSTPYIAWIEDCRWYTEDFEVEKENYPTEWRPLPEPWRGEEA